MFPTTLHKRPQIRNGKILRELTDVLAFHQYGSFFFEAKDLSIFSVSEKRGEARRTRAVKKHVKRAINQLVGASKAAKRGCEIFDVTGKNRLQINLEQPLHCIVLVTELMAGGNWSDIEEQLRKAIMKTGDFFHVIDLQELMALLKCSRGKSELFDYNLMEHCKVFIESGNIHIRTRPGAEDST